MADVQEQCRDYRLRDQGHMNTIECIPPPPGKRVLMPLFCFSVKVIHSGVLWDPRPPRQERLNRCVRAFLFQSESLDRPGAKNPSAVRSTPVLSAVAVDPGELACPIADPISVQLFGLISCHSGFSTERFGWVLGV
jgi:hypothetical protein